jgi:predicted nucleic acid-binding Zn ribbon protein
MDTVLEAPDMAKVGNKSKCQCCRKAFRATKPWQRFCSPKCRDEWHNDETRKAKAAWRKAHGGDR